MRREISSVSGPSESLGLVPFERRYLFQDMVNVKRTYIAPDGRVPENPQPLERFPLPIS